MDLPAKIGQSRNAAGLTPRQQSLVDLMVAGGMTVADAGTAAGYADKSAAYRAWKSEAVQAAFIEQCRLALKEDISLALATRRRLMDSRSDYVALEAAKDVLDRAGLTAPKTDGVTVGTINVQINL